MTLLLMLGALVSQSAGPPTKGDLPTQVGVGSVIVWLAGKEAAERFSKKKNGNGAVVRVLEKIDDRLEEQGKLFVEVHALLLNMKEQQTRIEGDVRHIRRPVSRT